MAKKDKEKMDENTVDENTGEPVKKKKHHTVRHVLLVILALFVAVLLVVVIYVGNILANAWGGVSNIPKMIPVAVRTMQGVPQEVLDELITSDEEGAAAIDALPEGDPDDTWAIYVYINGSNLEGGTVDNLSALTEYIVKGDKEEIEEDDQNTFDERVEDFLNEMWEKGSDLPESLYTVQASDRSEDESSEESVSEAAGGYGSKTIEKLTSTDLPENVKIVMMTGGSTSWVNAAVNPNRSQIFVYDTDGFREVANDHIKDMGAESTLSDFLTYCDENYPADHQILGFMDHGSGTGGLSYDNIYDDELSLKDIREALESVYTADPDDPPFDIIDLDACLMGNLEMAENLYGFTTYMVGTEEVGLGGTHAYDTYLEALAENTAINPAKIGQLIADGTIENVAEVTYYSESLHSTPAATMSVTDVPKAHDVYLAYEDLCAAVLEDSVEDISALTTMSRAATQSIRFGMNDYNAFNTIDLGVFASNLEDDYPKEAAAVLNALDEASIYRTATMSHKDATGLSVYYPTQITDLSGLDYFLTYVDEVCESDDIAALYYYTFAGCLNDEYTDYVDAQGYGTPKTLDTTPLQELSYNEITAGDGANFSLTLTEEQQALIQDMSLYLIRQDDDGTLNLGEDKRLSADENGTVTSDFDGTWISIDGRILEADVIDSTADSIRYQSEIMYQGKDSYMVLAQDKQSGEFSFQGVYTAAREEELGVIVANYPDELEIGAKITPVYTNVNLDDNLVTKVKGKSGEYTEDSKLGLSTLNDGDYYLMMKAYDVRGDEYYSAPMHFVMKGGKVTDASVSQNSYVVSRE